MFFDEIEKPAKGKKQPVIVDRSFIVETFKPLDLYNDEQLCADSHSTLIFDIECYSNYFLIMFKNTRNGKIVYFEMSPDSSINIKKLEWILWNFLLIGFNSNNYDLPMLLLCLKGLTCQELKNVSDRIINESLRVRAIEEEFNIKVPTKINHIDIIEVAPLKAGLKTYAGRLHCQKMQDLPFDPALSLTQEQAEIILHYCVNDLDNTQLLFSELEPQIKLRYDMSEQYGLDLRSKSDAQIAEHVLASEVAKINGNWPRRPIIQEGQVYRYTAPAFLGYATAPLQAILERVLATDFVVAATGYVVMPESLEGLSVGIGKGIYRMGIGGLHSSEEKTMHKANEEYLLIDRDVASYYPSIIINLGLFPKQMGKSFNIVYKTLVDRRLKAKHSGNKTAADSLKLTINGSFGKLGSKYSCLYSPDLLLQVTLTGQLALLMLIEKIELAEIEIVSANTDGIIIKCPNARYDYLTSIIKEWEHITAFDTEETRYKAVYSRDVNNYIAIKEDNTAKVKGCYSEKGSALNSRLSKNPEALICADAVIKLLIDSQPIEQTIKECKEISRFVCVRNVKGGAHKNGKYLGKVVRFYYAKGETGTINYVSNNNIVPKSEGARPLMDLAPVDDLDFDYYINEAEEMLYDLGYYKPKQVGLF